MSNGQLSIDQINAFDQNTFVQQLGFVFEQSPWIAHETWPGRPFTSLDHLYQSLCATMYGASQAQEIALIQAHPDLAGKAAIAGELTAESTREQASAGLNRLSPDEYKTFTRLNDAYRDTFGFPFVICVREHTKHSILAAFVQRLEHERDQEIRTALHEIAKIAKLRPDDAVRT